jgi:hypothetical protein
VAAARFQNVIDDGDEVGQTLSRSRSSRKNVIHALPGAVDCLLLMSMKPEWGTQRTLNGLPATENLPAGSMETLLVNQLVDGWSLDEGRVELNQWLRPEESAIQTRGDEPLYLSVTYLQEPLYICAVVPDEVFTVLKDVHVMSFADPNIV